MTGFKAKHCKENRPAHQKEKKIQVSTGQFSKIFNGFMFSVQ